MVEALGGLAPGRIRRGLAVGRERPVSLPAGVTWIEGEHPSPGAGSVRAGRRALGLVQSVRPGEQLVVLLSGGASSLLCLPAETVSLEDKVRATAAIMRAGADIYELNTVRKHLSRIKGGQLAAASSAPPLTLAMSDVVGDDLSVIGSGPTVPDPSTFSDALAVLDRFGGRQMYPESVVAHLERGVRGQVPDTPKPGDIRLAAAVARVVTSRLDALEGARAAAVALGYDVVVIDDPVVGDAREAALAHARRIAARVAATPGRCCLLSGGETTVRVVGAGRGGRNQEFAVVLARHLEELGRPAVAASLGTDGIDGPTDAAGALVDSTTMQRAASRGLVAEPYLADNNAYGFLDQLGDLVRIGPTGTNVGDLQIVLVAAAGERC